MNQKIEQIAFDHIDVQLIDCILITPSMNYSIRSITLNIAMMPYLAVDAHPPMLFINKKPRAFAYKEDRCTMENLTKSELKSYVCLLNKKKAIVLNALMENN